MSKENFAKKVTCPKCDGTGQIPDSLDSYGLTMTCPLCKRFGWLYEKDLKEKRMDWLKKELEFITWLYKYKNFLGSLKRKDFEDFLTREEAIQKFKEEK